MPEVLIIDDDPSVRDLLSMYLQKEQFGVRTAADGDEALALVAQQRPDLILLDIMMPDMDGFEVTRRLRGNESTAGIPILMFTAKTQLDDKVTGFEAGADDYLTKPTHPSELQAHVKALLARAGQRTEEHAAAAPETRGHVIGVLAARGGLGVSTVAVNVAAGLFTRTKAEVILAEMVPGKGTLGMDLGVANQKALVKFLDGAPKDITRERVSGALMPHISGTKLLLASDHPSDMHLIGQVSQYEALVGRLGSLARFIVLDLGSGLPPFVQKLIPLCQNIVVVLEGVPNTILHTKSLIGEITALGLKSQQILPVLNNRIRSDTQLPWTVVQDKLGHPLSVTLTPAPELLTQATRMQTAAILCQPEGITAQQVLKLVDQIIKQESGG